MLVFGGKFPVWLVWEFTTWPLCVVKKVVTHVETKVVIHVVTHVHDALDNGSDSLQ